MLLVNDSLQVTIDPQGAEIQSIKNRKNDFDYLWDGNPDFWPRHAPLLFPSIGNSNEESYYLNGKRYSMTQHGFARDYPFEIVEENKAHVALCQKDNEKTFELFPFHYSLRTDYHLIGNQLTLRYQITNHSESPMPFSLGSHPAFNVPLNQEGRFEDYFIRTYPKVNHLMVFETTLNPKPFRTGRVVRFGQDNHGEIHLNHELFQKGLLIFQNPGIDAVELYSPATNHSVTLHLKEFPYFTLWTTENLASPFLCIEPFAGLPDVLGKTTDWSQKEGNQIIGANEETEIVYSISFD